MDPLTPPTAVVAAPTTGAVTGPPEAPPGVWLGLHQLCHDLQHEVAVVEQLLRLLIAERVPGPLDAAALAQLRVVRATLREALLPPLARPVALASLVSDVVTTLRLLHHGTIELDVPTEQGCAAGAVIEGLPGELRRAVVGLIDHARAATPLGKVHVTLRSTPDEVVLEVQDGGSVAAGDPAARLGLAVVSDVARTHGGAVVRRSVAGGGFVVGLRLPRLGGA